MVTARPEAHRHRYEMRTSQLHGLTAEAWQERRNATLTLENFNAFARRQREDLSVKSAFIPSDSAFNEIHERTMRFIGAVMEVGRECGLEPDTDWLTASVANPPVLEKMANEMRESHKPYHCSVYCIAKAVESHLPNIFVEIWETPELKPEPGIGPACECVGVVGGETEEEVLEKLVAFRKEHGVVVTAPWDKINPRKRKVQPA